MITTYLSPKLMEELKDRAIRVAPGEDGTLIWVKAAGEWFWVERWQRPFAEQIGAMREMKVAIDRAFKPLERSLAGGPAVAPEVERGRIVPPPLDDAELPLLDLETFEPVPDDGERLKVLGRLFERAFRESGALDSETIPPLVWVGRLPWRLTAEELEAVRGIER